MTKPAAHLLRTTWTWAPIPAALMLMAVIYFSGCNHSLFLLLNHAGAILPLWVWTNLSIVGDGAVALALILLTLGRSPRRMWSALIASLIAGLWVHFWKMAIPVPRPAMVFDNASFFHMGPLLLHGSFPSGHATAAFTLAGTVILNELRFSWLRLPIFATACLISISRIMVGVHWPLDILAGLISGWISAYVGLLGARHHRCSRWGRAAFVSLTLLVSLTIALLFSTHTHYQEALAFQRFIAAICLVLAARQYVIARSYKKHSCHSTG
jgi:membrane-associated phospholipid phosphatase